MHRGEQVAHVQDADDVVERLAVDRVARVRRVEHGGERLLGRHLDRDRDDLRPGHHHVGDVLVAEDEDLVDHLPLALLDLALLRRAGEEHAQLRLRERLALRAGRLEPERRAGRVGRLPQHPDDGAKTVKNARTGAETQSAVPSAWPSATPFGTSSPITTWKKVRIAYARTIARTVAIHLSNSRDSVASPRAPMPSDVSVTPSCIAAMKRPGRP